MKWSWEHAKQMGFQIEDVVDETTGEIVNYKGFFLYNDRIVIEAYNPVTEQSFYYSFEEDFFWMAGQIPDYKLQKVL